MEKSSYYEQYQTASHNKLFYLHMAFLIGIITEVKPAGSGIFYTSLLLAFMVAVTFALLQYITYDTKLVELKRELKKKGLWKTSLDRTEETMSMGKFLKTFPIQYPSFAQSIIGILIFVYYLYATEIIPSTFLTDRFGWLVFIGAILLIIFPLLCYPMVIHIKPSPSRTNLAKGLHFTSPIIKFLFMMGSYPLLAISIHILFRLLIEPDVSEVLASFPSLHEFALLIYLSVMNDSVFERIELNTTLKEDKR